MNRILIPKTTVYSGNINKNIIGSISTIEQHLPCIKKQTIHISFKLKMPGIPSNHWIPCQSFNSLQRQDKIN